MRLKGGDPYVFGRGGEEALGLLEAGVAFEVVPGVTAALAAPALAGVPVTHRGLAAAVTVVTGHRRSGDEESTDWEALARVGGTVVVLMGVAERAEIARRLMAGGRSPATPVAVVERAGTAAQRVSRGRLDEPRRPRRRPAGDDRDRSRRRPGPHVTDRHGQLGGCADLSWSGSEERRSTTSWGLTRSSSSWASTPACGRRP